MSTTPTPAWRHVLAWIDDNILFIVGGFLLAFIPLWPKIPIWSPIEQYNVRVRIEDFFIFGAAVIWAVQAFRGKVKWRSPMLWGIAAYAVVGLISTLIAIFVIKTVPLQPLHVGKTVLHYLRYLEYFSLFFVLFSSITKKYQLKVALVITAITITALSVYGYGQRYWYWPVYSTMNREFSKGMVLYLTEHARVQSTFAGHYDLSAYLVVFLPIVLALAFSVQRRSLKVVLHVIHILGLWLLVVAASRTSFAAYIGAVGLVVGLVALQKNGWIKKIQWGITRGFAVGFLITIMMLSYGEAMYERFLQVLESYPRIHFVYHSVNGQRKMIVDHYIPAMLGLKEWPNAKKPENGIAVGQVGDNVLTPSDEQPEPRRPSDDYANAPEPVIVTTLLPDGTSTSSLQLRDRVWSECALVKGLSRCIREETLWPRAVAGFWRNPLTGSGYATLTKEEINVFTEADSTDNNFLRTLGETGVLGFLAFYGCVGVVLFFAVRALRSADWLTSALGVGVFAGSLGLLVNAIYIDVFAASKVALAYWGFAGLFLGYMYLEQKESSAVSTSVPQDFASAFAKMAPVTAKHVKKSTKKQGVTHGRQHGK